MAVDAFLPKQAPTITERIRYTEIVWRFMFVSLLAISTLVNVFMIRRGVSWSMVVWFIYGIGIIAIFYNPRYGVYMILFFALMGDQVLSYWYPFQKNLSSEESIMFLSRAVNFSPLESYIVITFISWIGRMAMERRFRVRAGLLFWPAISFAFFITIGFGYGITHGGDFKMALWEVRALYYLPLILILTSNLIETRVHVNRLIWLIALALFYKGIIGVLYVATELKWNTSSVEAIAEHSMSIQFNAFFILVFVVWFYRDSVLKRIIFPMLSPLMLYSFFANQRRAGFLTLGLGIGIV